ncbi:MAG: alpha/beta-type small acid-soluble spore protein [Limnochordia bacterium]|nr:alpha/beta-type small acid-soluble spore protein [Limnochordia bacterium]
MARRNRKKNRILAPEATEAMNVFKYEMASELGINPAYETGYWGNISSRECGAVGGQMVRRMLAEAENSLNQNEGGFKS